MRETFFEGLHLCSEKMVVKDFLSMEQQESFQQNFHIKLFRFQVIFRLLTP